MSAILDWKTWLELILGTIRDLCDAD